MRSPRAKRRPSNVSALALAIALTLTAIEAPAQSSSQGSAEVVFDSYSPLSANLELARRLLTPLKAAELPARLEALHTQMREQPIDLSAERFRIYVPRTQPTAGYGILVFIPPWQDDHIPRGWESALDSQGLIFVSAARSGNEENPVARREPLAILAAVNVIQRYPVDSARVFVSGFSGGSRVALRVALAYPELFRGALLDAGADPIGTAEVPLPPRPQFEAFRRQSRVFLLTGALDDLHRQQADASAASLKRWCVSQVGSRMIGGLSHDVAPAGDLESSLGWLSAAAAIPSVRSEACWTQLIKTVDQRLDEAERREASGQTGAARDLLRTIDRQYGGLAAPRITPLSVKASASSGR